MASPLQQAAGVVAGASSAQPSAQPNPAAEADQEEAHQLDVPRITDKSPFEDLQLTRSKLDKKIQEMQDALDYRKNIPFDPMMMQVAAGFLKPTKTGSFGESLGSAAENATAQAERDWVRQQEINKQKLALTQSQLTLKQQMAGNDLMMRTMGGAPGATTLNNRAPTPGGEQNPAAKLQAATSPNVPVTEDIIAAAKLTGDADTLKFFENKRQRELEERKIASGEYGLKLEPYLLNRTLEGVSVADRQKYEVARAQFAKDKDVNKLMAFYDEMGWLQNESRPNGGKGGYKLPPSQEEKAAEAERMKSESGEVGKKSGEMITNMQDTAGQAQDVKNLAREASGIARAAPNAFKLLANKDSDVRSWFDGVMASVKSGVQTPWGSFSIPVDIAQKAGLSDTEIQALQKFAQIEAQFTLFNRRTWLKGQGAISNGESNTASLLGPQSFDRPEVIEMKAQALELKADFDERAFKAYEDWKDANPSKGYGKFLISDDFKTVKDDYVSKLERMNKANAAYFKAGSNPDANAPKTEAPKTEPKKEAPKTEAPAAVPTVSGKEDPNYKSLKKGKQFIFQGKTYTKTED
jgi:hypothetical protein